MKKLFYKSIFIIFAILLVTTPVVTNAGFLDFIDTLEEFAAEAIDMLMFLWFGIAGAGLFLSGTLLDYSISKLVVGMANMVDGIPGIFTVWQMVRDITNMFLIFVILYIAIQTILGIGSFDYKKAMVKVVIVALFINFSLFFTNIMVDASNLLSTVFYKGIVGSEKCLAGGGGCLTYRVLNSLAIEKIPERDSETYQIFSKEFALSFFSKLMGLMVINATAIVFIVSAVIIIKRFITLILAMMFSSLAFASQVLPQTEKFWEKWFKQVSTECISTPIYFLYLWIVFKLLESDFLKVNANLVTTIAKSGDVNVEFLSSAAGLVMNYTIIIGLLAVAPWVAKEVGASGAGWAKSVGDSLQKKVGLGLAGRTAIKAGSGTIRGVGQITRAPGGLLKATGALGSKIGLKNYGGDLLKRTGEKMNNSDLVRVTSKHGAAITGFATRPIENIKVYGKTNEQYAREDSFSAKKAKVVKQYTDDVKFEENRDEYVRNVQEYEKADNEYSAAAKELEDATRSGNSTRIASAVAAKAVAETNRNKKSAELEKSTQKIGKNITKIDSSIVKKGAHLLSRTQLETIEKAEETEISKDTKKSIAKSRKESLQKSIQELSAKDATGNLITPDKLASKVRETGDELAKLDISLLTNPDIISLATREQLKAIKGNPDLTVSQTQDIMKARTEKINIEMSKGLPDQDILRQELSKLLPEDYANLTMSNLEKVSVIPLLRLPALKSIMENTSNQARITLRTNLLRYADMMITRGNPTNKKGYGKIKEWLNGDGINF